MTQTAIAGYGRKQELEADEFGAEVVLKAGYDICVANSIQMLRDHDNYQKAVNNNPTIYHGMLGSHPAHQKRLHDLVEQSQHLAPEQLNEPLQDFHEMLVGLRFGDDDTTGVVKDGVYYHGSLRLSIAFPKDWDIRATASEVFAKNTQNTGRMNVRRTALPTEEQTPQEYLTKRLSVMIWWMARRFRRCVFRLYGIHRSYRREKGIAQDRGVVQRRWGLCVQWRGRQTGIAGRIEQQFIDMVNSTVL